MNKYIFLINFTEKGIANVQQSPDRAEAFSAMARKLGAKVESHFWTVGPYDGLAIVEAPDDETASALALSLGKLGNIRSTTLRAFDAAAFRSVVGKIG